MTRTLPLRTIIRHFSHLFLTDGLTCIRLLQLPRRTRFVFSSYFALGPHSEEVDRDSVLPTRFESFERSKRHVLQRRALARSAPIRATVATLLSQLP